MEREQSLIKRLELLGGLGAGVLGAGIGVLFAAWLSPYAIAILAVGGAAHGWAMFAKKRIERGSGVEQPRWEIVAYWTCWLMLAGLFVFIAVVS